MKPRNLWQELCSYKNLELAYKKARKGKTKKQYVVEFEKNFKDNLLLLRTELSFHTYRPKPLITFILRDPKTRKISKSDFRDRIIHHALCNIIEPAFEKTFIYDSYANRKGKGTHKAIKRFDQFKRKISKNHSKEFFILKADIKKYFDNVNHETLIQIIKKRIRDERLIWLIKVILSNYQLNEEGKSMPLGNLTSQFFANIYLNELDQYVKHELKIKYYVRYVDDFVIFENNKQKLEEYKIKINSFLKTTLSIQLHQYKTTILRINQGINFLGLRIFYHHKLLRKTNIRKIKQKINFYTKSKKEYDIIYETFQGWQAYAKTANTYKLKNKIIKTIETFYPNEISSTEITRMQKMK